MEFVDTHCHIQFADYPLETGAILSDAAADGVTRLIAVGCTLPDSQAAVELAGRNTQVWASIGLHPHEAKDYVDNETALQQFRELAKEHNSHDHPGRKLVAIGEIGLDYYYNHSNKADQEALLRFQLEVAKEYNLPAIFHVRDAFEDFWPIYDELKVPGVIHSFTAGTKDLQQILKRDLHVGLNGIMTFSKNEDQLAAAKAVPLDRLVLETDAPFLTPHPYRGTICQPKHVRVTAEFLSQLRSESLEAVAKATTANARRLFRI